MNFHGVLWWVMMFFFAGVSLYTLEADDLIVWGIWVFSGLLAAVAVMKAK